MIAFLVLSICGYLFQSDPLLDGSSAHVFSNSGVYLCDLETKAGIYNVIYGDEDVVVCLREGDSKRALYNFEGSRVSEFYDFIVSGDSIILGFNVIDNGRILEWGTISSGEEYKWLATIEVCDYTTVPLLPFGVSIRCLAIDGEQYIRLFGVAGETQCLTQVFHLDGTLSSSSLYSCTKKTYGSNGTYISVYTSSSSSPLNQFTNSILDEYGHQLIGPIPTSSNMRIFQNNFSAWESRSEEILILYDNKGSEIHRGPFHIGSSSHVFSDGVYPCRDSNGLYGFVNQYGDWHIAPQFQEASSFSSGLAAVRMDEVWGYINIEGEFIIPAQYVSVLDFVDGYAAVTISDTRPRKKRAIDLLGNYLGDEYYNVHPLGVGLFKVEKTNPPHSYAIMNESGSIVVPFSTMNIICH